MKRIAFISRQYRFFMLAFTVITCIPLYGQNPLKIMPLGNSITRGETDGTITEGQMKGYRYELKNLLNMAGYNTDFVGSESTGFNYFSDSQHAGIGGSRDQYVARLLMDGYDARNDIQILVPPRPYLDEYDPDIILLHIGTNDITHEADAITNQQVSAVLNLIDQYEVRAQREVIVFLALIINRKLPCIAGSGCQTTIDFNNAIKSMALARIAAGDKIFIVDMEHDAGFNYDATDMADALHPNSTGYAKMASLWYSSITANYNTAPVFSAIPDQFFDEGTSSVPLALDNYIADIEDPDQDITWTAVQQGEAHLNILINANRQVIATPLDVNWNGSQAVVFTATDRGNNSSNIKSVADTIVFTVNPVNDPPVFTSTPKLTDTVNHLYEYIYSAIDLDEDDELTFFVPLAPSWIEFYPSANMIAGVAQQPGFYTIEISVTDGDTVVKQDYTVQVFGPTNEADFESPALNIYPNPASDHIRIRLEEGTDELEFTLFDVTGSMVLHQKISNTFETEVNLRQHSIPDGVYFYTILSSKERLTGKLIIYNE